MFLSVIGDRTNVYDDVTDAPHVETAVLFKWGVPLHQLAVHLFLPLLGRGTWSTWGPAGDEETEAPTH